MKRIVLISDTHGFVDAAVINHLQNADEVWHAGDLGNVKLFDFFASRYHFRCVFGNIDGQDVRRHCPEICTFDIEQFPVLMVHIAGKFSIYTSRLREIIGRQQPKMLVCGHSHILKIAYDHKHRLLYVNPGACGISGFHKVRTMLRFVIDHDQLRNMEIIELAHRSGTTNLLDS